SDQAATQPSNTVVPLSPPPPAAATTQASTNTAGPPETRAAPGTVSWAQRPTARRISELYPQRAVREGTGGRVMLDCVVQSSLSVACTIGSETPAGEGFGRAALSASSAYRASPTLSNGQSAVGARTRISVSFQAPQR
ncbi:MAG: energy transducer TonB, partial [Phycisphaerales bacterium]|nr:energy transducer TonB [Hyphomonadaceae bacterium]